MTNISTLKFLPDLKMMTYKNVSLSENDDYVSVSMYYVNPPTVRTPRRTSSYFKSVSTVLKLQNPL